ncbi:MAG: GTP-binding protein [Wigglesworthia glossinidia]|nr:GTP-binding protein [Wigglesworthia glossinidia]
MLNKISFFQSVEINFISAKTSYGISNLIKSIDRAYKSKMYTFKTSRLTHILYEAVLRNNLPVVNHTRIKLKYAHVGGYNPLIIIIHGTRASYLPKNYITYLKSYFIRKLNLIGMSLQMKFINK